MADLKSLITERGQIKSQFTRFKNFFYKIVDKETVIEKDVMQIQTRLSKNESALSDFRKIHTAILNIAEDETSHESELDAFDSIFFETIAEVKVFLNKHSRKNNHLSQSNIEKDIGSSSVRLPNINLPTFNGEFENWVEFHDAFDTLVNDNSALTNIQKFYYLLSCVKGEAAHSLRSLKVSSDNYMIAWNLLKKRFENKKLIVQSNITALFNLDSMKKDSHHTLQHFLDDVLRIMQSLKNFEQPTIDILLIYIISAKFSNATRHEWELFKPENEFPTFQEFTNFIENRCNLLGSLETNKSNQTMFNNNHTSTRSTTSNHFKTYVSAFKPYCVFCKNSTHAIFTCDTFLKLSVNQRINEARRLHLCLNCLRKNHLTKDCTSISCRKCNKKHNTLLHIEQIQGSSITPNVSVAPNTNINEQNQTNQIQAIHSGVERSANNEGSIPTQIMHSSNQNSNNIKSFQTILPTACIEVIDSQGKSHLCRALLDGGSQTNFITNDLCNRLGLNKLKYHSLVSGISRSISNIRFKTNITFKSRTNNYKANITCLVLDEISDNLPNMVFNLAELNIPSNIRLADAKCNSPGKIDILLGAGIYFQLLCVGQHNLSKNGPVLQKTTLGWILGGDLYQNQNRSFAFLNTLHHTDPINDQLTKFWALEECASNHRTYTSEEQYCENNFISTFKRNDSGRFIVNIPLKPNTAQLGNSKDNALNRFFSLERKLNRNIQLKNEYVNFLNEYEKLGHMTKISEMKTDFSNYYLPHHAVIKESSSTTKIRVVFDGSAKTDSGLSLNEIQCVGPTIQDDIFSILLRFRKHKYAITADITKMYRQVLVDENQRNLQLIIWRVNETDPINCYQLNTVTYGTASAPFLAVRCLKQLAIESRDQYPVSAGIIENDFYVDDLLTGANSKSEAINIINEVSTILSSAGFDLRKWSSNNKELLSTINTKNICDKNVIQISESPETKTLGVLWNQENDIFQYSFNTNNDKRLITKRTMLSIIAQIFDPLGLLGPVIINAKIIIQKLWQYKLSWDESIPLELHTKWLKFHNQLSYLSKINVPRYVLCENPHTIELHGFCDSSEAAYGCCIYVRSVNDAGECKISLLCAKSRVAPLKNISIPRLELCGALLLAKLTQNVTKAMNINFTNIFYWCDSTIVLSWIAAAANKWKTFVANRVSEIQDLTNSDHWKHVRTHENPADLLSRGIEPSQLEQSLWWTGPKWLQCDKSFWPISYDIKHTNHNIPESRVVANLSLKLDDLNLFSKFSSLYKLKRITAYCLRFIQNTKNSKGKVIGPLTSAELENALLKLIKISQNNVYFKEINDLLNQKQINSKSSILSLNPFLDDQLILRVGGRIQHSNFNYNKKHPIILPPSHKLTILIIRDEHIRLLHCGTNQLLYSLREKFWPISGKNTIKRVIHDCINCFRANPKPVNHIMGSLPEPRLTPAPPFYNCGVDYAGPILIKDRKGRGCKLNKAYICIFVCFATKAVHLDLVTSLDTETFLAALNRFIARRGQPLNIYSDNGRNFVGANSELLELHKFLSREENHMKINQALNQTNTSWHFIPPRSPHFGGLWEAGVKSVKGHLKRVTKNTHLTFEEFYTLLTQIEAVLNSRPLSPLSSDPSDLNPLTPAHFLIGRTLTSSPEHKMLDIADNRLSKYQHIQKLKQDFWRRWCKEYISELQFRTKWKQTFNTQLKPGVLVVIKEDNTPPLKWQLGRIIQLHPGADNVTRVISVKVSNGTILKRAVSKVCVFPVN